VHKGIITLSVSVVLTLARQFFGTDQSIRQPYVDLIFSCCKGKVCRGDTYLLIYYTIECYVGYM